MVSPLHPCAHEFTYVRTTRKPYPGKLRTYECHVRVCLFIIHDTYFILHVFTLHYTYCTREALHARTHVCIHSTQFSTPPVTFLQLIQIVSNCVFISKVQNVLLSLMTSSVRSSWYWQP